MIMVDRSFILIHLYLEYLLSGSLLYQEILRAIQSGHRHAVAKVQWAVLGAHRIAAEEGACTVY
jgi:hypothetical protein